MPWIFGLILALILGAQMGAGGYIFGGVIGIYIGNRLKSGKQKRSRKIKAPPAPVTPPTPAKVTFQIPLGRQDKGSYSPKAPSLTWVPPEKQIKVQEFSIPGGMIYQVAKEQGYPAEPSAICPTLTVGRLPAEMYLDLGYYPSYEQITPMQRRTYLEWLAGGRTDADPGSRALGYLFLFFYGLERRIILQKDNDSRLLEEIIRLLSVYAFAHKSRSLRSYFTQLGHYAGWRLSPQEYRMIWPRLLEFDGERPNQDGLRFVLANLYQTQEPLDWAVAYRLALGNENCRRSTVITRAQSEFWGLFQRRFEELFPEGMALLAAKQTAIERYRPASTALYSMWDNEELLITKLPNVSGLHSQFSFLPKLWNSCIDDLSGYSRTISSKRGGVNASWLAWQVLPRELQLAQNHPLKSEFTSILASAAQEGEFQILPVAPLAEMIGLAEKPKLTASDSMKLGEALTGLGYSIAPDTRFSGVPLAWNQEVTIVPFVIPMSDQLAGLTRLLFLAMSIAAADGIAEQTELDRFNELVDPQVNSDEARLSLKATVAALLRDPNIAVKALPQLAKRIPVASRKTVFTMMIHIAAADGGVELDELKLLRRLARAFDFEPDLAEKLLREDAAFEEITVSTGKKSEVTGEKIPAKRVPFALDPDRIRSLTQESAEVISMLSEVMADGSDEKSAPESNATSEKPQPSRVPEWLETLDERYRPACIEVIGHDSLSLEEFDSIAKRYFLLPDDLLASINGWSDEQLGDFLLERDTEVHVFRDLLPDRHEITIAT